MNEPNLQELPTRSELIRFLGRQRHSIAAVYDAEGNQVHIGGREAGEQVEAVGGPLRCVVCDAPGGQVTLMRVAAENPVALRIAAELGIPAEGYICFGGDHAGQRNKALLRPYVKATNAIPSTRLTKSGHAMQWQLDGDGKSVMVYARTSRAHRQSKAHKAIQKASRRANRG